MKNALKALSPQDLKTLTWPLVLMVTSILCAVILLILSQMVSNEMMARENSMAQELDAVRNRIADISSEEATIIRYIDQYRQIERSGVLRSEDRLLLLQTLDTLRTDIGLYQMSVSIENQQRTEISSRVALADIQEPIFLSSSRMVVRFSVAHEQDLLRFLTALQRAGSLSIVEQCSLSESATQSEQLARFFAECLITWVSIDYAVLSGEVTPNVY